MVARRRSPDSTEADNQKKFENSLSEHSINIQPCAEYDHVVEGLIYVILHKATDMETPTRFGNYLLIRVQILSR
jgi:hypothetical protein